jgi:hypothetical protein
LGADILVNRAVHSMLMLWLLQQWAEGSGGGGGSNKILEVVTKASWR